MVPEGRHVNFARGPLRYSIRDEFPFSDIHRSMNAMDLVQSKCRPLGVTLTLHGTHCIHTSVNDRKGKFISYIYTLLYIVSDNYLGNLM